MVRWDKMCKSEKIEGLGFRKVEVINKELLIKLVWRIISEGDNLLI